MTSFNNLQSLKYPLNQQLVEAFNSAEDKNFLGKRGFLPISLALLIRAKVVVGTQVIGRPPHRSVLEKLPYTAFALSNDVKAN